MTNYDYDSDGTIFTYFLVAILSLFLFPYTYLQTKQKAQKVLIKGPLWTKFSLEKCKPRPSPKSASSLFTTKKLVIAALWVWLAFLVHKASTTEWKEEVYDPYAIIGVDKDATKSEVKKAFRAYAKIGHPDKVREKVKDDDKVIQEENIKEAERLYIIKSKAYKVLTNEDARAIWDEFGDPDGKQALKFGIALPIWLVEKGNNFKVLAIYALIFGIGLPLWVARWWGKSKTYTKDKILVESMGRFFRGIKEKMDAKEIIELISVGEEFRQLVSQDQSNNTQFDLLVDQVKAEQLKKTSTKLIRTTKFSNIPWSYRVFVLISSHLLRIQPSDPVLFNEQNEVVKKATHLIDGILQIAISKNWLPLSLSTIDLGQNLVQAVYPGEVPITQLPLLDNIAFLRKYFFTKKRSVALIRDYLVLERGEREGLLKGLGDGTEESTKNVVDLIDEVAGFYPLLKIVKAKFSVLGVESVIPSAIVTLIVKIKLESPHELIEAKRRNSEGLLKNDRDPEDEEEKDNKWWENSDNKVAPVHAPYFPDLKTPSWWVIMGENKNGRLITVAKKMLPAGEEVIAKLQFQAPPKPGRYPFQIYVKNDSFVGCDGQVDISLIVVNPDTVEIADFEDDISEPDLDTFAGQMTAMKNELKGEYDDSDSDSDNEGGGGGGGEDPHDHSDPNHHH